MNDQHTIVINVNVLNPAQYLACCGIFAISALFDESLMSYWRLQPQPHFIMESQIDESAVRACLIAACTDLGCWTFLPTDVQQVVRADLHVSLLGKKRVMSLDWWYETLKKDGDIAEKSAWKMYAGNQKPQGIIQKMVTAAREMMHKSHPGTLTQLLALNQSMTGRFGLDCRSSRKALDAGFSANDTPGYQAATYPFLELLAVIGAHNFFPARTKPSHGNESTRGWTGEKVFQYALWMNALPIPLARVAAARAVFEDTSTIIPMKSFRASTGQEGKEQYGYLTLADRTTLPQGA